MNEIVKVELYSIELVEKGKPRRWWSPVGFTEALNLIRLWPTPPNIRDDVAAAGGRRVKVTLIIEPLS